MWKYDFNVSFVFFFTFLGPGPRPGRAPGPGPKAAARGPARARPAAALGPGPGSRAPQCENTMKIIWNKCENNVIPQFLNILKCSSYYFHKFNTFGAWDPDPDPKSHIVAIFLVIFISYYFHIIVYAWAGPPVHTAIFETLYLSRWLDLLRSSRQPLSVFCNSNVPRWSIIGIIGIYRFSWIFVDFKRFSIFFHIQSHKIHVKSYKIQKKCPVCVSEKMTFLGFVYPPAR